MLNFISDVLQIQVSTIQMFVIYSIGAIVLGFTLVNFLKYVVMGIFGIICLSAFVTPTPMSVELETKIPQINQTNQVATTYKKEFMEDCLTIAMNSKEDCELIFEDKN